MNKKFVAGALAFVAALVLGGFVASASSYDFGPSTIRRGSTGMFAQNMQTALNLCTGTHLTLDGNVGPLTDAAIRAFQMSRGLVVDGLFGTNSKASLNAVCMGTPAPSPTPSPSPSLSGDAGDINDVTLLGTPNAEAVGEGENDHKILGFEIEADNGSDLGITSVKVEFDRAVGSEQSGSSTHINDYISGVSVWEGSHQVGSANIDDFSKTDTGIYSKSITLSGATVGNDDTERFYVAVDGNNSVDSTDMLEQMGVEVTSIRFTDATGAVLTNTPTADSIEQYFTIESEADASNAKLTLTESSSNPNAGVVQVADDTEVTDGVDLLKFKMKATGSDLWIDELPVLFTTSATNVTDDTASVTLTIDGEDYSETVDVDSPDNNCDSANTCTVIFDNLDITLNEGDSVDASVSADINGVGGALTSGDTLKADITATQRNAAVVEVGDSEGDDLGTSSTDRVGTVSGETQGFYNQGITVTSMVDCSPTTDCAVFNEGSTAAGDAYGTFTLKFSVTAIGEDIFLDKTVAASSSTSSSTDNAHVLVLKSDGTTNVFGSGVITASDSNSDEGTYTFKVSNGQTADFTMSIASSVNPDSFIRAVLYALEWNTTDAEGANVYSLDMGVNGSYKTDSVQVLD